MDLTRCVSAKAKLPAPGLITVCSLEDSHDVSLFAQGMAVMNVDVCCSSGSKHYSGTTAAVSCGCGDAATGFPLCLSKVFQSLSALGPHVACLVAVEALSLIVALCFLGRFVLHILGLVFALDVLAFAFAFAVFALAFALRIRSELHWHWLTVDVLLCARDLKNLLSHLIPACDSDAVPDKVLFHSHVLQSQHRHSYLDIVVYGLC